MINYVIMFFSVTGIIYRMLLLITVIISHGCVHFFHRVEGQPSYLCIIWILRSDGMLSCQLV